MHINIFVRCFTSHSTIFQSYNSYVTTHGFACLTFSRSKQTRNLPFGPSDRPDLSTISLDHRKRKFCDVQLSVHMALSRKVIIWSNIFIPPARLCAVTYITEISLHVTCSNQTKNSNSSKEWNLFLSSDSLCIRYACTHQNNDFGNQSNHFNYESIKLLQMKIF